LNAAERREGSKYLPTKDKKKRNKRGISWPVNGHSKRQKETERSDHAFKKVQEEKAKSEGS